MKTKNALSSNQGRKGVALRGTTLVHGNKLPMLSGPDHHQGGAISGAPVPIYSPLPVTIVYSDSLTTAFCDS